METETNQLEYFGTELDCAGHYFWNPDGDILRRSKRRFDSLPFNPEELPRRAKHESRKKGEVDFYHENGYSIIAIEGSCYDKRWGSKSVFFIKSDVMNAEQMHCLLMTTEITKKIIDKMPFQVQWSTILPVYVEPTITAESQPSADSQCGMPSHGLHFA